MIFRYGPSPRFFLIQGSHSQGHRLSVAADDFRPVVYADKVDRLELDGFHFTQVPEVKEPIYATNVNKVVRVPRE